MDLAEKLVDDSRKSYDVLLPFYMVLSENRVPLNPLINGHFGYTPFSDNPNISLYFYFLDIIYL